MSEQGKDAERLAESEWEPDCTRGMMVRPAVGEERYCGAFDAPWEYITRPMTDDERAEHCWEARTVNLAALAPAPLPKSERPKSEASEPAPEAAHTDQGSV